MAPSSHSTGLPMALRNILRILRMARTPMACRRTMRRTIDGTRCRLSGSSCRSCSARPDWILSIIALRQINRTQERGKALAIAGIVISAIDIVIVIIAIILAITVGVYMVNHPETWNGSYCINGDCVYKDYGDSAFTSLAIMPLAALIG